MRSSMSTTSSPADRRRATNKVAASFMRQCYTKEGKAKTPPTHHLCVPKTPTPRVVRFALARTTDQRRSDPLQSAAGTNPSALMRSPHDLHGVFDMAPLPGFFGVALPLAGHGILGP